MNILYVAHRIPFPPNKGDKIRVFRHIEHLSKRHSVYCACFVDDASDWRHVAALRRFCAGVIAIPLNGRLALLRGLAGWSLGSTVTEWFYRSRRMKSSLAALCRRHEMDVAIGFSSSMGRFVRSVPAGRHVLDMCDVDSAKWRAYAANSPAPLKWIYGVESRRLAKVERSCVERFDATIVITDSEKRELATGKHGGKVSVVPNGVAGGDSNGEWEPDRERPWVPMGDSRGRTQQPTVGFIGAMDYRPNVDAVAWFVRSCWPFIRAELPAAEFRIVGRRPTYAVRRLGRAAGVTVVGGVPEVAGELSRFDVSVAPLRIARGLQNKVLEAMAASVPVVLTPQAAEGIAGVNGRDFVIAATAREFAGATLRLLTDDAYASSVGDCGHRFVSDHHDWASVLAQFELVVTGTVERAVGRDSIAPSRRPTKAETDTAMQSPNPSASGGRLS